MESCSPSTVGSCKHALNGVCDGRVQACLCISGRCRHYRLPRTTSPSAKSPQTQKVTTLVRGGPVGLREKLSKSREGIKLPRFPMISSPPAQCRGFSLCAEHDRQLGGGSPLSSLMTAKD